MQNQIQCGQYIHGVHHQTSSSSIVPDFCAWAWWEIIAAAELPESWAFMMLQLSSSSRKASQSSGNETTGGSVSTNRQSKYELECHCDYADPHAHEHSNVPTNYSFCVDSTNQASKLPIRKGFTSVMVSACTATVTISSESFATVPLWTVPALQHSAVALGTGRHSRSHERGSNWCWGHFHYSVLVLS